VGVLAAPVSRLFQGRQSQHALQVLVSEPRDDVADAHGIEAGEPQQTLEVEAAQQWGTTHQRPTESKTELGLRCTLGFVLVLYFDPTVLVARVVRRVDGVAWRVAARVDGVVAGRQDVVVLRVVTAGTRHLPLLRTPAPGDVMAHVVDVLVAADVVILVSVEQTLAVPHLLRVPGVGVPETARVIVARDLGRLVKTVGSVVGLPAATCSCCAPLTPVFFRAGRVAKILTARLILSRIVVGVAADRVSHLARDGLAANILVTVVVVPVRTIARRQHQQEQTPDQHILFWPSEQWRPPRS